MNALNGLRRQGAATSDGRIEGGPRDGLGVFSRYEKPRSGRSSAAGLRRRGRHHQGDRELLSPLRAPAPPGAPHAHPGGQGPEDLWPAFKARVTASYQAPSRAIARDLAAGVVADYATDDPVGLRKSPAAPPRCTLNAGGFGRKSQRGGAIRINLRSTI